MSAARLVPVQSHVQVLIVSSDDQDDLCLRRALEPECQLHRASGRWDAVSFVRRHRPKVVICDQGLVDGTWTDLLADLQDEHEVPQLIVASRSADSQLWAEVLNLGGYDVLTKPFDELELSRVVRMAARSIYSAGN